MDNNRNTVSSTLHTAAATLAPVYRDEKLGVRFVSDDEALDKGRREGWMLVRGKMRHQAAIPDTIRS